MISRLQCHYIDRPECLLRFDTSYLFFCQQLHDPASRESLFLNLTFWFLSLSDHY